MANTRNRIAHLALPHAQSKVHNTSSVVVGFFSKIMHGFNLLEDNKPQSKCTDNKTGACFLSLSPKKKGSITARQLQLAQPKTKRSQSFQIHGQSLQQTRRPNTQQNLLNHSLGEIQRNKVLFPRKGAQARKSQIISIRRSKARELSNDLQAVALPNSQIHSTNISFLANLRHKAQEEWEKRQQFKIQPSKDSQDEDDVSNQIYTSTQMSSLSFKTRRLQSIKSALSSGVSQSRHGDTITQKKNILNKLLEAVEDEPSEIRNRTFFSLDRSVGSNHIEKNNKLSARERCKRRKQT